MKVVNIVKTFKKIKSKVVICSKMVAILNIRTQIAIKLEFTDGNIA